MRYKLYKPCKLVVLILWVLGVLGMLGMLVGAVVLQATGSITHKLYPHTADFLALRLTQEVEGWSRKVGNHIFPAEFVGFSLAVRRQILSEIDQRGYDSLIVTPLHEGGGGSVPPGHPRFNYLENPERFLRRLRPALRAHKKIICFIHLEDTPQAQRKYRTLNRFGAIIEEFAKVVGPSIDLWVWGVEATEWISQMAGVEQDSREAFDLLEKLGRGLAQVSDVPQMIHLNVGLWGPRGGEAGFWRRTAFVGLGYQYGFPGSGSSDLQLFEDEAVDRTRQLVSRLKPLGKKFIAAEFSVHQRERWSRRLGSRLMRAGADGSWNGAQ